MVGLEYSEEVALMKLLPDTISCSVVGRKMGSKQSKTFSTSVVSTMVSGTMMHCIEKFPDTVFSITSVDETSLVF